MSHAFGTCRVCSKPLKKKKIMQTSDPEFSARSALYTRGVCGTESPMLLINTK